MKFKMNNREWTIQEVDQQEMRQLIKEYDGVVEDLGQYFGSTQPAKQKIFLYNDLCFEQQRQTLMHELMHCYVLSYLFSVKDYNEEDLCNISANSHDIIHNIVEQWEQKKTR